MTKSLACIGIVSMLAAGVRAPDLRHALDRGGRNAAANLGQACAASPDCMALGARVLSESLAPADDRAAPPHGRPATTAERPRVPADSVRRSPPIPAPRAQG